MNTPSYAQLRLNPSACHGQSTHPYRILTESNIVCHGVLLPAFRTSISEGIEAFVHGPVVVSVGGSGIGENSIRPS
jgi:hypothetical protein